MYVLVASCVLLTGCLCPANKKQGIPGIVCHPGNVDAVAGQSAVFEVKVNGGNNRYEWYRVVPIKDGYAEVSQKNKPGGLTSVLTLNNVQEADEGNYFCSIVNETGNELGDVTTRTRWAELYVYPSPPQKKPFKMAVSMLSTNGGGGVSQISSRQLSGYVSGTGTCLPPNHVATLTFTRDDQGQYFYSGLNTRCEVTVDQIINGVSQPLANTGYAARWNTSGGFTGCLTDLAGTTGTKTFNVTKQNKNHTFVICFVNAPPTGTTNRLTVTWY